MKKRRQKASGLWRILLGALFMGFLLFLVGPPSARAPHGGRNNLGGRTIATMQEQEFDRRLLQYQICHNVRFEAPGAAIERRRACKAVLVNRLDRVLGEAGSSLTEPLVFHCEDTAVARQLAQQDSSGEVIRMQPNLEFMAIDQALERRIERAPVAESVDLRARDLCTFLADCRWASRPGQVSFRKIWACFSSDNAQQRNAYLDLWSDVFFGPAKSGATRSRFHTYLSP
jgi:hypothetical protein